MIRGALVARKWPSLLKPPSVSKFPSVPFRPNLTSAHLTSSNFREIMEMLDKRLNDSGKNWRHVLKVASEWCKLPVAFDQCP